MELFYDERDDRVHESRGSQILYWLDDLGAKPLQEARVTDKGFVFAGARTADDYRKLVANLPLLRDRPEDREPLLTLDTVLDALEQAGIRVPTPRTWRLPLDACLPVDLTFPLFVRAAHSSWKRGGLVSRVKSVRELTAETDALRRAFGWGSLILAREWLDLASAGEGRHGPIPQEVRVWIIDKVPRAWSFHYLHALPSPASFPPSSVDLAVLAQLGGQVGRAFASRLVAADFARRLDGSWCFIEAGPGSCAGTDHEIVFKAVARLLRGESVTSVSDKVGGTLQA